mgnify:CR=1 FL=1
MYHIISINQNAPRKQRRQRIKGDFLKREMARQWCRNHWHSVAGNLCIVHPDGTKEPYQS